MSNELLLVGSVPLDTVEEVICTFGGPLGPYLGAMPDGEVGERRWWVIRLSYQVFNGHPELELLRRPKPDDGVERLVPRDRSDSWQFKVKDGVEKWTRNFDGKTFYSLQYPATARDRRLVIERFGPLSFVIALRLEDNRLHLDMRGWKCLGIRLPMALCVRSDAFEFVDDQGRFNFNVEISHPFTGPIVHYQGWLLRKS